jgi:DNA-binding MarR family transcriptional regulator
MDTVHFDATPFDDVPIPALLRAARGSYGDAIRANLAAVGFDDMPRNGSFVLGGMSNRGGSAAELVRDLGISKQAASQLIDTLVIRGYLTRDVDPDDRRRQTLAVTERGRAAATAIGMAVASVDDQLAELVSAEQFAGLRAGLAALTAIRERSAHGAHHQAHAHAHPHPHPHE